ncbi:MAG: SBBP repeat-containing protein, partial [Kiritimatiellota bacterium]|nr:SBBP repeat-containing protein [Kiritimatiellota bacterium]
MLSSARPPQCGALGEARVPFVANEGQIANPQVKYYAKTFGGTVYALADGKIVYSLPRFESGKMAGAAVIIEILQDAFHDQLVGSGKSRTAVNSFIGNRPENWRANLPAFDRLDFGEVYEGISLLLSAHGNNVEKIFVLAPGADPRDIAFSFEGASGIEIMPDGKLELQTALGAVYFTRPIAWQMDAQVHGSQFTVQGSREDCKACSPLARARHSTCGNFPPEADPPAADKDAAGPEARALPSAVDSSQGRAAASPPRRPDLTPVEVAYVLDEEGTVSFKLGDYDRNKVLVIDPLLASTFIGGGGADAVQAMAVDSQTNVYVAGYTDSSDFPTNSPYQSVLAGGQDAFVSKFDANLGSLSASTYLGGSSNDQVTAIGIDVDSRIWLAGYTESTNFPTSSPMCSNYNGNGDAFVAVLSANLGTPFLATYLGGSNADYAAAIAMDNSSRQQYVAGYTYSS